MGWKKISRKKVEKLLSKDLSEIVMNKLFTNALFLINSSKPARVVRISQELLDVFDKIKSKGVQPLFLGQSILDTKEGKARMNLQFAQIAGRLNVPKAFINKKAEQLFLYTRNVWSDSITRTEGKINPDSVVFVFNEDEIFLGLAFTKRTELKGRGRTVALKHLIDTGYYLRAEK